MSEIRIGPRDRLLAWLVTGPIGRLVAFLGDLAALWWDWARRRLRSALGG